MFKKILMCQLVIILSLMLTACGHNVDDDDNEEVIEEVYIDLGEYLEANRDNLITRIATEGEDVRITLGDQANSFIFTILIDEIELNEDNRIIYSLAFDSIFSNMEELFIGLAQDLQAETGRDYFSLRVIFVDVNEEEISSQTFTTFTQEVLDIEDEGVD